MGVALRWRRAAKAPPKNEAEYRNPAQLKTALTFGAIYGVILLATAWANDCSARAASYALASVSGLTDVDAITLSLLQSARQRRD